MYKVLATSSARVTPIVALAILFLVSFPLAGQQSYVTRYDVFGGYAFLNSPNVSLFEHGFATQIGFRPRTWVSVGFDYTFATGDLRLRPDQLLPELQTQLQHGIAAGIAAGLLPPNYPYATLSVPAHSRTQTFALGPQLAYRRLSRATLFLRPVYAGIIHETATPQPQDAVMKALVSGLISTPSKSDNVFFLGFGARPPVQRPVKGWTLHRAFLHRSGVQFRPEYREAQDSPTEAAQEVTCAMAHFRFMPRRRRAESGSLPVR
jgi:hypothetical protein